MPAQHTRLGDFLAFYRTYARSGIHAASTAALTAFGLLIRFHEGFAVLAILTYLLPLFQQYHHRENYVREREVSEASESQDVDSGDDTADVSDSADATDATEAEEDDAQAVPTWAHVDVSTDAHLLDVVTTGDGESSTYAVGTDGVVLARSTDGWSTVLVDGPSMGGATLRGIDAPTDGEVLWFTGDGGALGRYDVGQGRHTDHSAPNGNTSTWTDVAVIGPTGAETVVLANGSGVVLSGRYDGETVRWRDPEKPGSGSSITALGVGGVDAGSEVGDTDETPGHGDVVYAADTAGELHRSAGAADEWESVGVDGAGALTDVAVGSGSELVVTDNSGGVFSYDGAVWTPVHRADAALQGVAVADEVDDWSVAVGDTGSVLERNAGTWERRAPFAMETLAGVCLTETHALAVGENGTVLERQR